MIVLNHLGQRRCCKRINEQQQDTTTEKTNIRSQARQLMERVTPVALDNDAFAFGSVQEIEVGMALARAHRVTYVGELGWELYVSADQAVHVFDALVAAADGLDFRLCGMHALDSCRLEKGYRHFGHDITDEDGPLEAGLSFAVKPDKPVAQFGRFIGCDAFQTMREQGPQRRLLQFLLQDPEALLFHNEPVLRDGEVVAFIEEERLVREQAEKKKTGDS